VGKSLAAYVVVRAFGHGNRTALTISASLAQIGEFSFILIGLGITLEILPVRARSLLLSAAIISILLNPVMFALIDRLKRKVVAEPATAD
jgi:CPA2 family monovalent cation:H+ antiporter-2